MSMSDPISDMISRIRNAAMARHATVRIPKSKVKVHIAQVLLDEGYIAEINEEKEGTRTYLVLNLKYQKNRANVIRGVKRESKSGGRRYVAGDKIYSVASGYGTLIISTSKGVMTGSNAKKLGLGGEPLVSIW